MIKYIVANIGSKEWEKKCPGTAYTAASRARTIGKILENNPYPTDSNLFFDGQISERRFTDCIYKDDGNICMEARKRREWVTYLLEKADITKKRGSVQACSHKEFFVKEHMNNRPITSLKDLDTRIVDMLQNQHTV